MAKSLQDFVESVNGTSHLRIEHDFGDGFVRLHTSEAERRQAAQDIRSSEDIVVELLRNSRDAHASNIFLAMSKEGTKRHLTVIDDGSGIPASMHDAVFEPRVTSKLDTAHFDAWGMHGRGMALYSVRENAEQAHVVESIVDMGCAIQVVTDLAKLGEKTDQSSFPTFSLSEDNTVAVRGPKNIIRTACEFAIESRSQCSLFVGSPAEICATLYRYGLATLSAIDRLFCRDLTTIPLCKRLATAATPQDLADIASDIGLSISERTARRIMDCEIESLDSILERITITGAKEAPARRRSKRGNSKAIKLEEADKDKLSRSAKRAFADIADRYYLEPDVMPTVKVRSDRISITVPVVRLP